jgi:uncharacterized lipoprotein NlpE involved in copper resistance
MKKILTLLTIIFTLFWLMPADAQVVDVPNKAKEHFFKKYPDAKNADWNNNVVSYAAKFNMGSNTYRAYYHMDGTWDYTEVYLEVSQVPAAVKESFSKSRYADWKVNSYNAIESNKGKNSYQIQVEKGIEKTAIYFDKNGKEVKGKKAK